MIEDVRSRLCLGREAAANGRPSSGAGSAPPAPDSPGANGRGSISFFTLGDLRPEEIIAAGGATVQYDGRSFRLVLSTMEVDPITGEATCEIEEVGIDG